MSVLEDVLRLEAGLVGVNLPRVDSRSKVAGKTLYSRDLKLPRMLYARFKRSPFSHARILGIETGAARKLVGVRAILIGGDFLR